MGGFAKIRERGVEERRGAERGAERAVRLRATPAARECVRSVHRSVDERKGAGAVEQNVETALLKLLKTVETVETVETDARGG